MNVYFQNSCRQLFLILCPCFCIFQNTKLTIYIDIVDCFALVAVTNFSEIKETSIAGDFFFAYPLILLICDLLQLIAAISLSTAV